MDARRFVRHISGAAGNFGKTNFYAVDGVRLPLLDCSNSRRHIALSKTTFYHFSAGLKNFAHVTGATPGKLI